MSAPIDINILIQLVLNDAEDLERSAGMNGSFDDGGASALRDQIRFFKYGLANIVPLEWKKYKDKEDEDYKKYLELKARFE